jgi:hypothetical protein
VRKVARRCPAGCLGRDKRGALVVQEKTYAEIMQKLEKMGRNNID